MNHTFSGKGNIVSTLDAKLSNESNSMKQAQPPKKAHQSLVWMTVAVIVVLGVMIVADRLVQPNAFRFEKISVVGKQTYMDTPALLKDLKTMLNGNYFSVDMRRLEGVKQAHPWVKSFSVRKKWPTTLQVWVEEYQPVAHWGQPQVSGSQWLTTSGQVVQLPAGHRQPEGLPLLSGALEHSRDIWATYQRWSQQFNRVGLAIASLDFSPSQVWTARVVALVDAEKIWATPLQIAGLADTPKQGAHARVMTATTPDIPEALTLDFQIKLLVDNAESQLIDFLTAVNGHFQTQLVAIKQVDLRYHHGFAVKWREPDSLSGHSL